MSELTVSERLFESWCACVGASWKRIPKLDYKSTPDYEVSFESTQVLVEVKQIDPNREEQEIMRKLDCGEPAGVFGGEPGRRAAAKIRSAAKQLRAAVVPHQPALVVLYDNVPIGCNHTDPYAIKTAMHGLEAVILAVPGDSAIQPHAIDRRFVGRRSVTEAHNTTLSAIAVIRVSPESGPELEIYHNPHAAVPLRPACVPSVRTRQYCIEDRVTGEFQEWQAVD